MSESSARDWRSTDGPPPKAIRLGLSGSGHLPRTLSISQVSGIAVAINLVLLLGLGVFALIKLNGNEGSTENVRQQWAEQELALAVERVMTEVSYVAHRVARWDETRAQLVNPSLYTFWRSDQLIRPDWLPTYVEALELYDDDGRSLAPAADPLLPAWVSGPGEFVAVDSSGNFYQAFVPIAAERDSGAETPGGLVGIRVDLDQATRSLSHYRNLDPNSLGFILPEGESVSPELLIEFATFDLLQSASGPNLIDVLKQRAIEVLGVCLVISTLAGLIVQRMLQAPLAHLEAYLGSNDPGQLLAPPPQSTLPIRLREVERLNSALEHYRRRLNELHNRLDSKDQQLQALLRHDPLSSCGNRRAFEDDWTHMLSVLAGRRVDVSFILFDCDHLKAINSTYGHEAGDEVIRGIGRALRSALRDGDRLYRLGSDEFVTILVEASLQQALELGAGCLDEMQRVTFQRFGIREPVRISAGVSHALGSDRVGLAGLHRRADRALIEAKRPGGPKLVAHAPTMEDLSVNSNRFINAVYRLMEGEDILELFYQPVIDAGSGSPILYEALARVRDDAGIIGPGDLLPVIEIKGLTAEFDRLVLARLLCDLDDVRLPRVNGVSVNLSAAFLMQHDVVETLAPLQQHLACRNLILEVTETALITSLNQVSDRLAVLRNQGFTIALDDFGSGYSSLSYLSRMPVDVIKFDIGMVRDLAHQGSQRDIVRGMAQLVADAGYRLVAEGVESSDIEAEAVNAGFQYLQGFLFGQPMELDGLASASKSAVHTA